MALSEEAASEGIERALEREPTRAEGQFSAREGLLMWGMEVRFAPGGDQRRALIFSGHRCSIQLSYQPEAVRQRWLGRLLRAKPRVRHWLGASLRTSDAKLSLCAEAPIELIRRLPRTTPTGAVVPLEVLLDALRVVHATGARLAFARAEGVAAEEPAAARANEAPTRQDDAYRADPVWVMDDGWEGIDALESGDEMEAAAAKIAEIKPAGAGASEVVFEHPAEVCPAESSGASRDVAGDLEEHPPPNRDLRHLQSSDDWSF